MHISAYEACLERIAEELMGRRKWKHYQDTLITRNHFNIEQSGKTITEQSNTDPTNNLEISCNNNNNNIKNNIYKNHRDQEELNGLEENHLIQVDQNNKENGKNIYKNNNIENTSQALEKDITSSKEDLQQQRPVTPNSASTVEPVDWKPNDKCHFCINGKLLTVNSNGELVAETGLIPAESDHIIKSYDSDSNSNDSKNIVAKSSIGNHKELSLYKLLKSQQKQPTNNMTSMDSMVARAIQTSIPETTFPDLNWLLAFQQQQQQHQQQQDQPTEPEQPQTTSVTPTTSETSTAAISPALKDSPSPSYSTGEQPLDLSSKPSPNSSISGDIKISTRTKTTPTPSGRKPYSEEDLNNALQDILSHKLGTRKAAVQYNIPRSTLRNKKNKQLAMEAKLNNAQASGQDVEMENDLSGEEAEGSNTSTPQPLIDQQMLNDSDFTSRITEASTPSRHLGKSFENNGSENGDENSNATNASPKPSLKSQCGTPPIANLPLPQTSPLMNFMDPNLGVVLQTLLLSSGGLDETVTVRDLLSSVFLSLGVNIKDVLANQANQFNQNSSEELTGLNNGKPNTMMDHRLLLEQLQRQQQPPNFSNSLLKSETPETNSSMDTLETCDDPVSLIKIPSFKPVANSGSSTSLTSGSSSHHNNNNNHSLNNINSHRNGDSPRSSASPHLGSPSILAAAVTNRQGNSLSVMSPPKVHAPQMPGVGDAQTSPALSLREIIASSIHRTMNEQANKEAHNAASMLGLNSDGERFKTNGDYKKGTIYVAKNIGGTDTSSFGAAPNLLATGNSAHGSHLVHQPHTHLLHPHSHGHPHSHPHGHPHIHSRQQSEHLSRQEAAALAAGKGTRPKRGKYRNYDRNSLVEAVKAVQRGEMSVHRAGSYYGVPHSTLEYKVKERHLMRPRKREPKPQTGLEGTNSNSSSKNNSNIPGHGNHDKPKNSSSSSSSNSKLSNALKSGSGSSAAGVPVNGLKMPMFDPAAFPYPPSLLWAGASPFGPLQMDFNRNAGPQNDILKSTIEMYQRAASGSSNALSAINNNCSSPGGSPLTAANHHHHALQLKELAENMGESDLDGIIRKSLNRKNSEMLSNSPSPGSGVLDQLLMKKSNLPFTNHRSNDYECSSGSNTLKRSASPLSYTSDVKRERDSSDEEDEETSRSAIGTDEAHEHNNNNSNSSKYHNDMRDRSRLTSRDSETDGSSVKSDLHLSSHHNNNSANSTKINDINGKSLDLDSGGTSILQEKLAQIKAEQNENEDNL